MKNKKLSLSKMIDKACAELILSDRPVTSINEAAKKMGTYKQSLYRSISTEKIIFNRLVQLCDLMNLEISIKPKKKDVKMKNKKKKTYYATLDFDGYSIKNEGSNLPARILKFDSMEKVKKYLLDGHSSIDEYKKAYDIEKDCQLYIGTCTEFSDCWLKTSEKIKPDDTYVYEPFSFRDLQIKNPGQHPGGNFYWIDPIHEIHVLMCKQ